MIHIGNNMTENFTQNDMHEKKNVFCKKFLEKRQKNGC